MRKIVICDDDEKIVSQLIRMIERLFPKEFQILGYVSSRQLVYEIDDGFLKFVDMLFLDLEMGDMDGTDVAKYIQRNMPTAKIIFITGYPERSQDIFDEIKPAGLLLKPLDEDRLQKYIQNELLEKKDGRNYITVKKEGKTSFIPMDHVFYVESSGRKLLFHTTDGVECVYERISNFCNRYPEDFARCHQSYAVNWNQVIEVTTAGIKLRGGFTIPVSRQRYREIQNRIFVKK